MISPIAHRNDVRFRIPKTYDRVMDWCAVHFLPAPKPIGRKLFGYQVTRTDVAVVAYAVAGGIALSLYYSHWWWFVASMVSLTLAWTMCALFFDDVV
jgi:hypothetical protein